VEEPTILGEEIVVEWPRRGDSLIACAAANCAATASCTIDNLSLQAAKHAKPVGCRMAADDERIVQSMSCELVAGRYLAHGRSLSH